MARTHRSRPRLPSALAPPVLPRTVDRLSEAWWQQPPARRAIVAAVAVVVLLVLVGRDATRSPWGSPTPVLVATADLAAGTPLDGAPVATAEWPGRLAPDDALAVPDGRLRTAVLAGQVLTRRHVAVDLAGLVGDGEVAVSVPLEGLPTVAPRDRVDAIATGADGAGRRVARSARVLALDGEWLWLAVPEGAAGAVAAAGAAGRLTLTLRGRSG